MKKIGYMFLGLGISILLYIAINFLWVSPMAERAIGRSAESYIGLIVIIIIPICLIIGNFCSGYLIQPLMKQRSFFRYLLISPGIYVSLANLIFILVQVGGLLANFVYFSIIGSCVWGVASFVGTRMGVFLRDRKVKIQQSDSH